MNPLAPFGRKLTAFFVDDALLGGATALSVLLAALCRLFAGGRPLIAGALLAGGCLLALTLSVAGTAATLPAGRPGPAERRQAVPSRPGAPHMDEPI